MVMETQVSRLSPTGKRTLIVGFAILCIFVEILYYATR